MKPSYRLLIIETHPVFASMVQEIVRGQDKINIEVLVVNKLETGIKSMISNSFDMVFIDVKVAKNLGGDFWEQMVFTADRACVVAVGSHADFDDMVRALENGACECLFRNIVCKSVLLELIKRGKTLEEKLKFEEMKSNLFCDLDLELDVIKPAFNIEAMSTGSL